MRNFQITIPKIRFVRETSELAEKLVDRVYLVCDEICYLESLFSYSPTLQITPIYQNTFSFANDFPALLESVCDPPKSNDELFQMGSAKGTCKVMCFHPKSNVSIALMKIHEIKEVIKR
jgi:galactose-1-phosphate uridylyltransferase